MEVERKTIELGVARKKSNVPQVDKRFQAGSWQHLRYQWGLCIARAHL